MSITVSTANYAALQQLSFFHMSFCASPVCPSLGWDLQIKAPRGSHSLCSSKWSPPNSDALAKLIGVPGKCVGKICCWDVANGSVNSFLEVTNIPVLDTFDYSFDLGEEPYVQWIQIQTVPWMRHDLHVKVPEEILDSGLVCRCTVVQQHI